MKRFLSCIALVLGMACGAAHAEAALTDIDQGLKIAQAKQLPVFVDFSAVWCHSCHAMDDQVLNGADWDKRQSRFVLVRSDADGTNGSAWMKKLNVPALPVYVVLNPDGSERGRITGEMKRDEFYPALDRLLSGEDSFDKLKADAGHGSVEAATKVLRAYDERDQPKDGMGWFAKLPEATRKAVQGDATASTGLAVVQAHAEMREMLFTQPRLPAVRRARLAKDCRGHAQQAFNGSLEPEARFEIASTLLACARELPPGQQKALASAQLPALKALYDKDVPGGGSGVLRQATYTLADYYKAVGDTNAEKGTYTRAIAIGRKALDDGHGGLDVKRDRSMAEVLSEFLGRKGPEAENTVVLKAMAAAWPDDFFCQYMYGEDLLKHGKAAEALPYLEYASKHTTPAWGLSTAYAQAKALVALHRRPEAEKLFNAALRRAEKQFPEITKLEKPMMKL